VVVCRWLPSLAGWTARETESDDRLLGSSKPLGGGPPAPWRADEARLRPCRSRHSSGATRWETVSRPAGDTGGSPSNSLVVYRGSIRLVAPASGDIPAEASRYMLGSRSALEWLIDRCRAKTDKESGIVNDRFDWCREHGNPRYIVDLLKRITRVSVETMKIVDSVPELPL